MSASPSPRAAPIDQSWIEVVGTSAADRPGLPEKAPPNSLLFSELVTIGAPDVKSANQVIKMSIVTKEEEGKVVYFKKCSKSYPPILAQVEAASSASMRITRGENAARVRPVVDEEGNVVGAASYEIPTFTPLSKEYLSVGVLIRLGVMDELVARYVRMEDDLHGDQIGVAEGLGIVGVDFDEEWYTEITVEIKGPRAINNGILAPLPADLFPLTDRDIDHFPNLRDAQPCHWPTKLPNNLAIWKRLPNREEFIKLAEDPMARKQAFFAFLRELVIDPEDHLQVMIPNFARDEEGRAMIQKMRVCVNRRWAQLLKGFANNRGFRRYLVRNKTAIVDILEHFGKYNRKYSENGATIDLDKVKLQFQELVRKCMCKDLTMVLYDLGCTLKGDRLRWERYQPHYVGLIDICRQLESGDTSFPEAFFTFECELSNLSLMLREKREEWQVLTKNIVQVSDNYRGLVTKKMGEPVQSIYLEGSRRRSMTLTNGSWDREKCIARALKTMLMDPARQQEIIGVVQKAFKEYAPSGHSSSIGSINPFTYTRTRVSVFDILIKNLVKRPGESASLISTFTNEGAWNTSGYVLGASANVILIRRLVEKALNDFKTQITLEQLRRHDLVEICFTFEKGELDIENSARQIKILFQREIS